MPDQRTNTKNNSAGKITNHPAAASALSTLRQLIQNGEVESATQMLENVADLSSPDRLVEQTHIGLLRDAPPDDLLQRLAYLRDTADLAPGTLGRYHLARGILFNRSSAGFGHAIRELNVARSIYAEASDELHESEVMIELGRVFSWSGQEVRSLRCYAQALSALLDRPHKSLEFQCHWCLGKLNLEMRRWDQAMDYFQHAGRVAPASTSIHHCKYKLDHAQALLGAGEHGLCQEALLALSDAEVHTLSFPYRQLVYYRTLALSFIRSGNLTQASKYRELADSRFREAELGDYEQHELQRMAAEYEHQFGDAREALGLYRALLAWYAEKSYTQPCLDIMTRMAQTLVTLNEPEQASSKINEAVEYARQHGSQSSLAELRTLREQLQLPEIATEESNRSVGFELRGKPDAYVLIGRLGAGSYGSVFRAYDLEREQEVALKRVDLATYNGRLRHALKASLRHEVQACARIQHPGIARVLSWGEDNEKVHYITQEYIRGPTLTNFVQSGVPSIKTSVRVMRDLFLALDEIHRAGLVHCDVKPENIILRDESSPVLVDFGIACLSSAGRKKRNIGTVHYMSPEALLNFRQRPSNDIYAAGLVFLELLGYELPSIESPNFRTLISRQQSIRAIAQSTQSRQDIVSLDPLPDILGRLVSLHIRGRPKGAFNVANWLNDILDKIES